MRDNLKKSLELVLVHEGAYSNNPKDPGGPTNHGITQRVYDLYRKANKLKPRSVKAITADECAKIYKNRYWDAIKADQLPKGIDYVVFDGAVNSGPQQSVKWLQRALGSGYRGNIDGMVGPSTLAAVEQHSNHDALIAAICDRRLIYLRALTTWKTFGRGWKARVGEVAHNGQLMATGAPASDLVASYEDGGDAKALIESAEGKAWKGPADAVTGAGTVTTVLSQATDQLTPFSDIELVAKVLAGLTVAGVLLAIGGFGWRYWAEHRRKARADALDLEPAA